MRTLIVDDSPVIRILLQRVLAGYGDSESAGDGQEGLNAYIRGISQGLPFDLVCLDLGLPVISGIDLLQKIRSLEAESNAAVKTRVLVITASRELDVVDSVRRYGADGFLVKPIEKLKLVEYLTSFGFPLLLSEAAPYEKQVRGLEAMCDEDKIPTSVLARLIQRMARSMVRQLSDFSPEPLNSTTKINR